MLRCLRLAAAAAPLLALAACQGLPAPATRPAARPIAQAGRQTGGVQLDTLREVFRAAWQRAQQGQPGPPDSRALKGYALYDYLLAARLERELQGLPGADLDERIDGFLRAHDGQPVTRDLRRAWLVSLASRARWDWFLPRAASATDPLLICERLAGRLATGDTAGLAAAALARWSQPIEQPPACDAVFDWLQQQGLITAALAEQRVRAALVAGNARLARQFAAALPASLPAEQLAPLLQWTQLLASPRATLAALVAAPTASVEPQALQAGFWRLALHDSAAATALLPALLARSDTAPALRAQLQRDAALGLAYDHDPEALVALRALPDAAAADDRVQQWRVRAALWAGDYRQALEWIEQMPPALAAQPRWRYWRARATAALDGPGAAAPLFATLAGTRGYYGYLAADRLHRPYQLNARASADDPAGQALLAAEPGLIRAHELLACGLYDQAVLEWAVALQGANPATQVQAAHLAANWGWYAQSIATLAAAGEWDDLRLRYPRPYPRLIAAASTRTRLPADWILAVMRQESLFRADAVSRADARGLMQLQLPTASGVAQRWQLPPPAADALFDPPTAVMLGAARLRELLDRYDGELALALAAYNAGPMPLARWLPSAPMDADVWIESIPYDETRGYVEHILEHIVAYGWTRNTEPPQLASLLPPVQPLSATPVVPTTPTTPATPTIPATPASAAPWAVPAQPKVNE